MTVDFSEGRLRAAGEDGGESASCSAVIKDGVLYLQDLRGDDPAGVIAIFRFARELSRLRPVFFPLREGGVYGPLRRIAERMGAQPYVQVWVLGETNEVN